MRYTALLRRIFTAASKLKLSGIFKKHPEAVRNQIYMWIIWLKEDTNYSKKELEHIETILLKYMKV